MSRLQLRQILFGGDTQETMGLMIGAINRSANKLQSASDVIKLLEQLTQSKHELVGHGSAAITVAFSDFMNNSVVVRILLDPAELDPWFDGCGKYCLRRNNGKAVPSILPRVYNIVRTKSVGVAFLERLSGVGTLLAKVNKILPTISDDTEVEHLLESIALYFSGDRSNYYTGKENLSSLLGTNDRATIANVLVDLQDDLGFKCVDVASLYYKIIPACNVKDHDVDIRSDNVGWRSGTGELVIIDPVA